MDRTPPDDEPESSGTDHDLAVDDHWSLNRLVDADNGYFGLIDNRGGDDTTDELAAEEAAAPCRAEPCRHWYKVAHVSRELSPVLAARVNS